MTSIKSVSSNKVLIVREGKAYGGINFQINEPDHLSRDISVPRSEMLAALGLDELGCGCDDADQNLKNALARAEEAEAKLAEAEATIERVNLAIFELDTPGNHRLAEKYPFEFGLLQACKAVRAALDPKPTFELPTEAGVQFTAHRVGGLKGQRSTFTTMADGLGRAFYFAEPEPDDYMERLTDHLWEPDRILTDWTDHRLLESES